jgi:curved DNA-binding protein CbpA
MSSAPSAQPAAVVAKKPGLDELGAAVVLGLHRLVKQATLYDADNEAQVNALEMARQAVATYGRVTRINPKIFFHEQSVFVGGRLLRAGRTVYSAATELGRVMRHFDIDEIALGYDVPLDDLKRFQAAVADALRRRGPSPARQRYQRIRLRRGEPPGRRRQRLVAEEAALQVYASTTVVMRRFYEALLAGATELPQGVRRSAMHLADLGRIDAPGFLATTAVCNVRHEPAGRAVNGALVALGMAGQLTNDKRMLARIALAALLLDAGVPTVAGADPTGEGRSALPRLFEGQLGELAQASSGVVWALSGFAESAQNVVVLIHEALSVLHQEHAPALYAGARGPTLAARIVATARRFTELLSDDERDLVPEAAVRAMLRSSRSEADLTAVRMLVGALVLYPVGALVELSNGEIAQVVRVHDEPTSFGLPVVRTVVNASGGRVEGAAEIDLGAQLGGDPLSVKRLVELGDGTMEPTAAPADARHALVPDVVGAQAPAIAPAQAVVTAADRDGIDRDWDPTDPELSTHVAERAAARAAARAEPPAPAIEVAAARPAEAKYEEDDVPSLVKSAVVDGRRESVQAPPPAADQTTEGAAVEPPAAPSAPPAAAVSALTEALPEWLRARVPDRPRAQGTLAKTPLVHLLVYGLDQGLTGTIVLAVPNAGAHALYLDGGAPAKARMAGSVAPLDRVLVDLGLLDEDTLQHSLLAISKTRELHGRYLTRMGLLDAESLRIAVVWQLVRKVTHLLKLPPDTRYAYYDAVNLIDDYGAPELTPAEPLALIMTGVRLMARHPLVDDTLARLGGAPLRLARDAPIARLVLKEQERRVVDLLRTRASTLIELCERDVEQERVVKLTIYALLITRCLNLSPTQRPPVGADRAAHPLPSPSKSQARKTRAGEPGPMAAAPSPQPPAVSHDAPGGSGPSVEPTSAARAAAPPLPSTAPRRSPTEPQPLSLPQARSSLPSDPDTGNRHPSDPRISQRTPATRRVTPRRIRMSGTSPRSSPSPLEETPIPDASEIPLASLTPSSSMPPERASDPGTRPRTSGRVAVSSPKPPRSNPPGDEPTRTRLTREHVLTVVARIDNETHYEILGVDPKATPETIQSAYFKLAKLWHPDRLSSELEDVRVHVARAFARMNEAYHTVSQPERRREYDAALASGAGAAQEREIVERVVDSAVAFQKAEILFRRGKLDEAEHLLRRAAATDPGQPEYQALLAWVQAQRKGTPPELKEGAKSNFYRDEIRLLNDVVDREPNFERALFYRAELLKRSGFGDRAQRDYRRVVRLNPRNIDAAREVRLHDLRKRSQPRGLLGRLLNKPDE